MVEHEAQELPSLNSECTLLGVELHVGPYEGLEHILEVLHVLVERVGLHHYVVHVDLYTSADQPFEDLVHEVLVGCPCVLEVERHDLIVVVGVDRHERLLLVFGVHTYLVIARISIQEAQDFMASCPVHQAVDVG